MTQMLNLNLRLIFVLEIPKSCLIFVLSKWWILTAGTQVRRYPVLFPPVPRYLVSKYLTKFRGITVCVPEYLGLTL